MRRAEGVPNERSCGDRENEEANREACNEAEAHQETRQAPGEEPPPSSTARFTVPPPRQGGGNGHEERPCQDHFDPEFYARESGKALRAAASEPSVLFSSWLVKMRRAASLAVIAAVGGIALAALAVELWPSDEDQAAGSRPVTQSDRRLPRCRSSQLRVALETLGGTPVVVLRLVSGPSCRVGGLHVLIRIRDQRGEPVPVRTRARRLPEGSGATSS